MTDNERYFLTVAEELNISRAAKKLYISQQCLSKHILRMEEKYHTRLFVRKPKLLLTPAGEAVKETLYKIQRLETELDDTLNDIKKEANGTIILGIARARAPVLLPKIVAEYGRKYPNVKVVVSHDYTESLEEQAINGKIDVFIGIKSMQSPALNYIPLQKERIFFVISESLMRKIFPRDYQRLIRDAFDGIDLHEYSSVPLVLNTDEEGLCKRIYDIMRQTEEAYKILFQTNDPYTRMSLCLDDFCASFFPEMTLWQILEKQLTPQDKDKLHAFPVKQPDTEWQLVIAHPKSSFISDYRKQFIRTATEVVKKDHTIVTPR